ncbi:unnamed protein product [Cladocopium goreaui]|uniref:Uncharacterized protein n=1 Tax=Cladocopium goreaui TaxID=2562237 RepID=A0A9P1GHT0_9DINO|nr:unnamed protein product [Cladocopium goreaui]
MDAATQGAQKSKEEMLPAAWSGLEDVRKTMSKLSETQTQQEDRIRGLAHKVDQVSGSHDILDRDQKATFREMSNSISDLNIKLGSRTSRLEEDFKALQEEVTSLQIEIRSTLNGALMTPSRSLSGVVCEGDTAITDAAELRRKLREVAEAPMRTLASDQPGISTSATPTSNMLTVDGTFPMQVHPEALPRQTRMQAQAQMRVAHSIATPQRPSHLSPSSSWSHLAPFHMPGTVSFPVANWNPYVHAEQQELHRVVGHPARADPAHNWKETPTRTDRRMSGAFTSPPLSARLPPRAETSATPTSTGATSTPTGAGQVIRPVRLSYPWPPPPTN